MLSGNRLLFPRRCGFTPHRFATAKGGGVVTGLVPLPRTHLLSSTNDGSCFIPVGSKESQQKLYACDGIQSSLNMLLPPPSLRYWLEYYINIISDLSFQAYHHRYGCSYIHLTYLILFDCCVSVFFLLAPRLFAVLLNAFSVAISVTDDTPVTDFHQALAERFLVTSKKKFVLAFMYVWSKISNFCCACLQAVTFTTCGCCFTTVAPVDWMSIMQKFKPLM